MKYKQAIPETVCISMSEEETFSNSIKIECECPNEILYCFQGSIEVKPN